KVLSIKEPKGDSDIKDLRIVGKVSSKESKNSDTVYNIIWNKASLLGKETNLDEPFLSKPHVEGEIDEGDKFTIKGKPEVLAKAYEDLTKGNIENEKEKKKEEKKNELGHTPSNNSGFQSGGYGNPQPQREMPQFNPQFEKLTNVTTTDGCTIRVDLSAMQAVVQERVLRGGKEIVSCHDSNLKYEIVKDFQACTPKIDAKENVAFKQYRLSYRNSKDEVVQVEKCQPDKINPIQIVETIDGCTQSNFDDKPIVNTRKIVDIDGVITQISQCLPKVNAVLRGEICQDEPYYYNEDTKLIHVVKAFFYDDNGNELQISSCIPTDEIINAEYETCGIKHSDNEKMSYINAFPVVIRGNEKIKAGACMLYEKAPYTQANLTLIASPIGSEQIKVANDILKPYPNMELSRIPSFTYDDSNYLLTSKIDSGFRYTLQDPKNYYNQLNQKAVLPEYGYTGVAAAPWLDNSGNEINFEYSDELPTWSVHISAPKYSSQSSGIGDTGLIKWYYYDLSFSKPVCYTSMVNEVPTYIRIDGSTYKDLDSPVRSFKICGSGRKLGEAE
ncbi:MAG: hypothetical protein J0G32_06950, partial [Alphaproteobacteria bacterium]|nr:hypothetical protein [Alphaproteobacteria bacterium]